MLPGGAGDEQDRERDHAVDECGAQIGLHEHDQRGHEPQQEQPRGALPIGPMVIFVHFASVWVPFTSEAKEAIASYDEILEELRLALMDAGRKLGSHVRKGKKLANEFKKRNYIEIYIPHLVVALKDILKLDDKDATKARDNLTVVLEKSRKL